MADKDVIIIDETKDEKQELSIDELEQQNRAERLKKALKVPKLKNTNLILVLSRLANVFSLLLMVLSMLAENGDIFALGFIVFLIGSTVNYFFYK